MAITSDEQIEDYCKEDDKTLVELNCDEAGGSFVEYICPNACVDGVCIENKPIINKTFNNTVNENKTLLRNNTGCPIITAPSEIFCITGTIQEKYDDETGCLNRYSCMKTLSNGREAEINTMNLLNDVTTSAWPARCCMRGREPSLLAKKRRGSTLARFAPHPSAWRLLPAAERRGSDATWQSSRARSPRHFLRPGSRPHGS